MAVEREVLIERAGDAFEGMKISWGGVFGGVLAGIGTLMLLSSLGLAIGVSAVDPTNPDGSAIGMGAAIWTALTLLIALFVGGWASTRLSMLWERTTAMFEGVLVWVLSLILVLYLAASGISLITSGLFSMVGQTAQATLGTVDARGMSQGSVDDMLAKLRDPQTASTVAGATGMSQQEVSQAMNEMATRVEAARNNPQQAAAEVRSGMANIASRAKQNLAATAESVQPEVSTSAWMTFLALVLSLIAAIAGAAVGRRGVVRKVGV